MTVHFFLATFSFLFILSLSLSLSLSIKTSSIYTPLGVMKFMSLYFVLLPYCRLASKQDYIFKRLDKDGVCKFFFMLVLLVKCIFLTTFYCLYFTHQLHITITIFSSSYMFMVTFCEQLYTSPVSL